MILLSVPMRSLFLFITWCLV